jgi:hypothetical protein
MDRRALKPPIEPLSQRTWQAIEARVFEELERLGPPPVPSAGRATPKLAIGLAALALAASVFALLQNTALQSSQSTIQEQSARGPAVAPALGSPQPEPALVAPAEAPHFVTTAAPAEAHLGDSRVRIAEQSDVRIEGNDDVGWRVLLERGEVSCEVAPRGQRPPFVVSAGDVAVRVVGTRFAVFRRASGTRVQVEAGHVQVEHAGTTVLIGPGESWPANGAAASPLPPRRAARARVAAQRLESQREFERAAQLESSDPAQALAAYRHLSQGRGAWAANALYARARLLLDGGQSAAARSLLTHYVAKYPAGANAADARRLLESLAPSARAPH